MVRLLLALVVVLGLAAVAEAAHRSIFGRVRERVVVRERAVIRGVSSMRGASCIGTVRAGCAGVTVSAGCSGYSGPAMLAPRVVAVPAPMPVRPYWPGTVPWKK